ncbi:hypothetical protein F5B22DRAFT_643287 [Xylaria bambusicola]|uniref:uncharacterized protein n=1 Tax=Xylaria bambusicola TaxID=326684 RepID=UPI0020085E52|nr:uncharacterized protein F5B22DRAFT_643287 [Xylaria bambusicola]KAI0522268.1 hypothetical protein F5B22DRAFT_643287 [Xylaria bambusicola]
MPLGLVLSVLAVKDAIVCQSIVASIEMVAAGDKIGSGSSSQDYLSTVDSELSCSNSTQYQQTQGAGTLPQEVVCRGVMMLARAPASPCPIPLRSPFQSPRSVTQAIRYFVC